MMKQQQNGEQVGNYVSPSDNILSPASAKLNAFKEKRFAKSTKPRSLFNKTDSSTTSDSREHLQADAGSKGDAKFTAGSSKPLLEQMNALAEWIRGICVAGPAACSQTLLKQSTSPQKRKRGQEKQEAEHSSSQSQEQRPSKRLQTSPSSRIDKEKSYQAPTTDISEGSTDPLQHWIKTSRWRKEYFEQDSQVREDFERGKSPEQPGRKDWLQENFKQELFQKMDPLTNPRLFFARPPLSRKQSQSNLETPSDQTSQGGKSSQYNSPEYEERLERKGSYMHKSPLGITDTSRELCQTLLEKEQSIPQDTLFRDDLFDETCQSVQGRNEAMIVRDITPLICPSAQILRVHGAKHLNILYESVNEAWSNMNSYEGTLPQPDYSVGFRRTAFTEEQLGKLKPFVGEPGFKVVSYFMATTRIYFPFFTCEVKCGAAALDFADRQNAQSMSVALRAFVVLFRYVKREKKLDREILAFSVSHDHRSVRIYGHYPVIEGDKTSFYRHPLREFSFTEQDGKEKWTTYKFVKNVYDHHMPKLHKLICSAIDDLPADINFDLSQSAPFSQSTSQSS
ncbi:MAG: hypothetical protein M1828_002993 [Chrysothrix sp. TS-e1954]|nr:MAG: hypothetical protein M1828_002993 [Chrysothrix sp. TS-e1954]